MEPKKKGKYILRFQILTNGYSRHDKCYSSALLFILLAWHRVPGLFPNALIRRHEIL